MLAFVKTGGTGGAKTLTGARFEEKTDLTALLTSHPEYAVVEVKAKLKNGKYRAPGSYDILRGRELVAKVARKTHFTGVLLPSLGIEWEDHASRDAHPDEAIWFPTEKRLVVLEKKSQATEGSTDEKLGSGPFRLDQYSRVMALAGGTVDFWFILDPYFAAAKYKDVLTYAIRNRCKVAFHFDSSFSASQDGKDAIRRVTEWGCFVFEELPLEELGFGGLQPRKLDVIGGSVPHITAQTKLQ